MKRTSMVGRRSMGEAKARSSVTKCRGSYTTYRTRRSLSPYLVMSEAMASVMGRMSNFFPDVLQFNPKAELLRRPVWLGRGRAPPQERELAYELVVVGEKGYVTNFLKMWFVLRLHALAGDRKAVRQQGRDTFGV